jgi:bifunctional pyridoxal-dependent enzyme with beta-cystathionase and maltose regulon repressor activities
MKWGDFAFNPLIQMMTLADMDLPLHEPFRQSILHRLRTVNNFTYKMPSDESLTAIANWYRKHHLIQHSPEITP